MNKGRVRIIRNDVKTAVLSKNLMHEANKLKITNLKRQVLQKPD